MTNKLRGVLYIGVTGYRDKRIYEHKNSLIDGFTKHYKLTKLVYLEETNDIQAALQREKNLKHWLREWKIALIEQSNPEWKDLAAELDPRVKPEDDNHNFKPEDDNPNFKPEDDNHNFKPEDDNHNFKPEDDNPNFKPEDDNYNLETL